MLNRTGIVILSGFATLWLIFAKVNAAPIEWSAIFVGGCFSVLLIWLSYRQKQAPSLFPAAEQKRLARVFMWSSIGEGIGIFIVINVLVNLGMADRFMAGIALVVGLHFIPIALKVPGRIYSLLTVILVAISVIGFAIPSPPYAALCVGGMCALTFWAVVCASIFVAKAHVIRE